MLTSHLLWHLLMLLKHGQLHRSTLLIFWELYLLGLRLKNLQGLQSHLLTLVHSEVLFLCQGIPVPLHRHSQSYSQKTKFHVLKSMEVLVCIHYHFLLVL